MSWEAFLLFSGGVCVELIFLPQRFGKFAMEAMWVWSFLCRKVLNYEFNFFSYYWTIQVIYFFLSGL